jgi:hypothetical protein
MAFTTSTTSFNPDVNELFEEAFERCGKELRTGYDFRTARRTLNFLITEWANRGINLWTVEQGQIPLVQGQYVYDLPLDTVDLIEHVIRTNPGQISNQTDINISRISVSTYSTIPNKLTQGRPIQVWVNRQSGQKVGSDQCLAVARSGDVGVALLLFCVLAAASDIRCWYRHKRRRHPVSLSELYGGRVGVHAVN